MKIAWLALMQASVLVPYDRPAAELKVEIQNEAEATVEYPQNFAGELRALDVKTFNLGQDLPLACQKAKDRIRFLKGPWINEASKKFWRDALLQYNTLQLKQDLQPWIQASDLELRIMKALPEPPAYIKVMNPLRLKGFTLTSELSPDALSLQLESPAVVGERLKAFSPMALQVDGHAIVTVTSLPLVCDLITGHIQLGFALQGTETYEAQVPLVWKEDEISFSKDPI